MTLPLRIPGLLEATLSILRIVLIVPSGNLSIKTPLEIDLIASLDALEDRIALLDAILDDLTRTSLSDSISFDIDFTRCFIAVY